MRIPESRTARYAERGRPQTTHRQAERIAHNSLTTRRIAPRPPAPVTDERRTQLADSDRDRPTTADLRMTRREAARR